MVIIAFICLCLKDKVGQCSINYHIYAMTGNRSASLRVLANSLVLAKTGNSPQRENEYMTPFSSDVQERSVSN